MITRENYEVVFVDYFDGRLDKRAQEELFAFLRANADLNAEFDRYSGIKAEPDYSIGYSGKDRLKKDTITHLNYRTWLVAYIENDLDSSQRREVEYFLSKNPNLKPELEILRQSRLVPDRQIIFNKKNSLKKGGRVIAFQSTLSKVVSVAAAVVVCAILYYFIHDQNTPEQMISSVKENSLQPSTEQPTVEVIRKTPESTEKKSASPLKIKQPVQKNSTPTTPAGQPNNYFVFTEDPEAMPEENACNDYIPPVYSESPVATTAANNEKNTVHPHHGLTFEQIKLSQINLSDIFDDEDMKELEKLNKQNLAKAGKATQNILDLAAIKLQEISKGSDISYEKKKDVVDNTTTYAIGVGKGFSISHTKSN